jgi:hypothetical protein
MSECAPAPGGGVLFSAVARTGRQPSRGAEVGPGAEAVTRLPITEWAGATCEYEINHRCIPTAQFRIADQ